jgi:acetyl-CoA carboxylase beta subunit
MACACKNRSTSKYVWTSADGSETMTYNTEIEAKAKVLRKGGSYKPVTAG